MTELDVDPKCFDSFEEIKIRHKYKYMIMGIVGEKALKVLELGDKAATLEKFIGKLQPGEPRYCVLDHVFKEGNAKGAKGSKLFFITWAPETSSTHQKMRYTTQRTSFLSKITGVTEITAGNVDDILSALGEKLQDEDADVGDSWMDE